MKHLSWSDNFISQLSFPKHFKWMDWVLEHLSRTLGTGWTKVVFCVDKIPVHSMHDISNMHDNWVLVGCSFQEAQRRLRSMYLFWIFNIKLFISSSWLGFPTDERVVTFWRFTVSLNGRFDLKGIGGGFTDIVVSSGLGTERQRVSIIKMSIYLSTSLGYPALPGMIQNRY